MFQRKLRAAFYSIPLLGHMNPSLPLVRELTALGVEVTYYCDAQHRGTIENHGAIFRGYQRNCAKLMSGKGLAEELLAATVDLTPGLIAEANQFDFVLSDSTAPWGFVVAQKADRFCASSMAMIPGTAYSLGRRVLRREENQPALALLKKRFGYSPTDLFYSRGDINIVYTSRFFQPTTPELSRDDFCFVGPAIGRAAAPLDFTMPPRGKTRVIYVTFGSVANLGPDIFVRTLSALEPIPNLCIVVATGQTPVEKLGPLPSRVIARQLLNQSLVLERADACVCHGTINTSHDACYNDVPLVVIPLFADQPVTADRIEELGAGLTVNPQPELPVAAVTAAVKEVLRPRGPYRDGARRVGDSLRQARERFGTSYAARRILEAYERRSFKKRSTGK